MTFCKLSCTDIQGVIGSCATFRASTRVSLRKTFTPRSIVLAEVQIPICDNVVIAREGVR